MSKLIDNLEAKKSRFFDPLVCNKCGFKNETKVVDMIDNLVTEYDTTCTSCKFKDRWSYGVFESIEDGYNMARK